MKKVLRPKKYVLLGLFAILFITVFAGTFLIVKNLTPKKKVKEEYVSTEIVEDVEPVISDKTVMIKPFTNEGVKVGKTYYDYKAESAKQEKAITYYNGSYIQNSGIDYTNDEVFDVVSVLDGEVTEVKEDELLGKIVEIKHGNDFVATYQSLSEITVKKGDSVTQGQVIGKSGTNKIDKEVGNHLHFELYTNGQIVDPMLYIEKEVSKE